MFYKIFGEQPWIKDVPDPQCRPDSVVIEVRASGICRSDWHGWMGHDPDISLPHVPGHELSGIIIEKGSHVTKHEIGERVTLPFSCGCGMCATCLKGDCQICDHYFQPGFTAWGSFAQYVEIRYANENLVGLPEEFSFEEAAILGCRFGTSYRALIVQADLKRDQSLAVFGCGGVGLSAIAIAKATGAEVVAIDIQQNALARANNQGADHLIHIDGHRSTNSAIRDYYPRGVDVTLDAIGHPEILNTALASLCKRGKHIQVGLMTAYDHESSVNLDLIISRELEILGSHGIQATRYNDMLNFIEESEIDLKQFISHTVNLEESVEVLTGMGDNTNAGVSVITRF